jgi:cysteinyl-tRNA synthetase
MLKDRNVKGSEQTVREAKLNTYAEYLCGPNVESHRHVGFAGDLVADALDM